MMQNILPASYVKGKLSRILKQIETDYERYIITVKGHPKAVLLSYEEFEDLQEELEILTQNPNFFQDKEQAHKDLKAGTTVSLAELNRELGV